jgi:hypothetical protein
MNCIVTFQLKIMWAKKRSRMKGRAKEREERARGYVELGGASPAKEDGRPGVFSMGKECGGCGRRKDDGR